MIQDALEKVDKGLTAVEELRRIFHSELENPELANDPALHRLVDMIKEYEASDEYQQKSKR